MPALLERVEPGPDVLDVSSQIRAFFAVRSCRVCGCTDNRACAGGCCWVEYDLCSACAEED